jgi:hypothetical protein
MWNVTKPKDSLKDSLILILSNRLEEVLDPFIRDLAETNGVSLEELKDPHNNVTINIITSDGGPQSFNSLASYIDFMYREVNHFGWVDRKRKIVRLCPVSKSLDLRGLIRTLAHEKGHMVKPVHGQDHEKEEAKARSYGEVALWAYDKAMEITQNNYTGRRIIMDLNSTNFGQVKGLNESLRPFVSIPEEVGVHYVMAARIKQAFTVDTGSGIVSIPNLNGGWFVIYQADGAVTGMDFDVFAASYRQIEAIPRAEKPAETASDDAPDMVEPDGDDPPDVDVKNTPEEVASIVADDQGEGTTVETIGPDDVGTVDASELVGDDDTTSKPE